MLNRSELSMSEPVEIWGGGFVPGEAVTVSLVVDVRPQGAILPLGTAQTNAAGAFVLRVSEFGGDDATKADALGVRTVLAEGESGSAAGTPVKIVPAALPEVNAAASLFVEPAAPGGMATVWGAGFRPKELVSLVVLTTGAETGMIVGGAEANANGSFTVQVSLEDYRGNRVDEGLYTLMATGGAGSQASAPLVVTTK